MGRISRDYLQLNSASAFT